jgi:hypothetical protein
MPQKREETVAKPAGTAHDPTAMSLKPTHFLRLHTPDAAAISGPCPKGAPNKGVGFLYTGSRRRRRILSERTRE